MHGGSRGVCRRRLRGDALTYQGNGLLPAGEATTYPSHPRPEVETPPHIAVPTSVMLTRVAHTSNYVMQAPFTRPVFPLALAPAPWAAGPPGKLIRMARSLTLARWGTDGAVGALTNPGAARY